MIKKITFSDITDLQSIGKATFYETFISTNTESDMNDYLEHKFNLKQLETELNETNSQFFFGYVENEIAGYLKVNIGAAQNEQLLQNSFEIERIYVLSKFHGNGIAKELFTKAINIAKDFKLENIWLGVWEHNPRAIRFYEKNGFEVFNKHIFKLGADIQTDLLMKRKFNFVKQT